MVRVGSWIFSLLFVATTASAAQFSLPARTMILPSNSDFPATYELSAELKRQRVELKGDNGHVAQVDLRVRGAKAGVTVGLFLGRGIVDTVTLSGASEQTITLVNRKGKSLIPWILVVRNGGLQVVEMRVILDSDTAAPAPAPVEPTPAPAPAPVAPKPIEQPKPVPAPVQPKPVEKPKQPEAPKPAPAPVQPKPAPVPVPTPKPVQPKPAPAPAPAPAPVKPVPAKPAKPADPVKSRSGRWSANQTIYYVDSRTNRAYLGRISGFSADGRSVEVSVTRKGQVTVDERSNRLARTSGGCVGRICAGDELSTYDARGIIRDVVIVAFQPGGYAIVKVLSTGDLIGNWPLTAFGRRHR